jgi:hypothetical protein
MPCACVDCPSCEQAPAAESGTVLLSLPSLNLSATQPFTFAAAGTRQVAVQLDVPESAVTRWWPVQHGPQQLYDVQVTYTPTSPSIACRSSSSSTVVTNGPANVTGNVDVDALDQELNTVACIRAAQSSMSRRIGFRCAKGPTVGSLPAVLGGDTVSTLTEMHLDHFTQEAEAVAVTPGQSRSTSTAVLLLCRTVTLVRRPPSEAVKELLPAGEAGWGESPSSGMSWQSCQRQPHCQPIILQQHGVSHGLALCSVPVDW